MTNSENPYITLSYSVALNGICTWLRSMDDYTFTRAMECMPSTLQVQLYEFFSGSIKSYEESARKKSMKELQDWINSHKV